MFFLVGLGLCDEKDITVRGLEAVRGASRVYLEAYTSILLISKDRLEQFYGRELIVADRDMVESDCDSILEGADLQDVVLLVVGDPLGATTHSDILLRAKAKNIPTRIIHNASIMNAVGAYTWKPDSFYDRLQENAQLGLHTLVLLDIKVKEQSEENLARGRSIYEPPRYMSVKQAVSQLIETEQARKCGVLFPETTLAIALSRVGGGPEQNIVAGTLAELVQLPNSAFGEPLHSLVIVGKRLHPLEVVFTSTFAVDDTSWRLVAKNNYGCTLH